MRKELMKTFWKGPLSVLQCYLGLIVFYTKLALSEKIYTANTTFSHNSTSNNTLFFPSQYSRLGL